MNKFRVELWRIVKFLLITAIINLPLTILYGVVTNALVASHSASTGVLLSVQYYAHLLISTLLMTLVHRYFTFRATEPWYIAVPIMLVAVIGWQLLKTYPMAIAARQSQEAVTSMSNLLAVIWLLLQYLLQRCVIYCHTTDINGWYRRFHPTNEEGVHPNE